MSAEAIAAAAFAADRAPTDQPRLTKVTFPKTRLAPNEKYAIVRECRSTGRQIELCFDVQGPEDGEPIILIMGIVAQMCMWSQGFVDALIAKKFCVIRLDNRDAGRSIHFEDAGAPSMCCLVCCGCCVSESYSLPDMASDVIALADLLKLDKGYHVAGQSMGGMIAQHVAVMDAARVKTCTLISTSTGDPSLPKPSMRTMMDLSARPKDDSKKASVDNFVDMFGKCFAPSNKELFTEDWLRDQAAGLYEREPTSVARSLTGLSRQFSAVAKQVPRMELVKRIKMPILVMHGRDDVVVSPECGKQLHELIPDSRFWLVPDMGHGILPCHCKPLAASIAALRDGSPDPNIPSSAPSTSAVAPAAPSGAAAAAAAAATDENKEPAVEQQGAAAAAAAASEEDRKDDGAAAAVADEEMQHTN